MNWICRGRAQARAAKSNTKERGRKMASKNGRAAQPIRMVIADVDGTLVTQEKVLIKPDLKTVVDQKFLPAGVPEKVIEAIENHGLDVWVYTDREWFVRDPNAAHVAREQWTVKFPPTVAKTFAGLLGRVAKIVGVSDDYDRVAKCEKDVQQAGGTHISAARSQPYYLDVTHPQANKGGVVLA